MKINVIIMWLAVTLPENELREFPACAECNDAGGPRDKSSDDRLHCECGSLLARYVGGGIELKCRRCKRTVIVPVSFAAEATQRGASR
jgi:hypothetical protein